MSELFRRLFHRPALAAELITASLFVNLLSLASPIFVIQILNRYVAYGFDGTLITLTSGMVVATVLLFAFSLIRNRLALAVSARPDMELGERVLSALARIKAQALHAVPRQRLQEAPGWVGDVQAAYQPANLLAMVDLPFSIIFLTALLLLSWPLALVTFAAMGMTMLSGWLNLRSGERISQAMRRETMQHRGLVHSAIAGAETVRAFLGAGYLGRAWSAQLQRLQQLRLGMAGRGGAAQAVTQAVAMLLRVGVYALGAYEVVQGNLTVGGLIGASILSAKALQQASGCVRAGAALKKAGASLSLLGELLSLPQENTQGAALAHFSANMAFRDVSFTYPGAVGPLFEGLDFSLKQGSVLLVKGDNGSGKSTLCKLMAGLYEPSRGQVLADGVDLRQFSPLWWRMQVMYVPQDPGFLQATMGENLTLAVPDADDERINVVIRAADLKGYLDAGVSGLHAMVSEGGSNLPMGIRKRLALARALLTQGRLAVLDEPTEGLDTEGCAAVYAVVNNMIKQGVTIIMVTRDMNLAGRATQYVELSGPTGISYGTMGHTPRTQKQAVRVKAERTRQGQNSNAATVPGAAPASVQTGTGTASQPRPDSGGQSATAGPQPAATPKSSGDTSQNRKPNAAQKNQTFAAQKDSTGKLQKKGKTRGEPS